jgi:glycerophosphoryl diester phosphodiesterase
MANLHPRLAGYDGRLGDLKDANPLFTPWISDNWQNHFQWRGEGPVPPADRKKLRQLVTQAHANNVQLRLWAIPDHSASWALMKAAGVDFINTDRLAELSAFLQK